MSRRSGVGKPPTIAELAREVGISQSNLSLYFSRGCPRTSADEIREWRDKNVRGRADISDTGAPTNLAEAKLALMLKQCDRESALAERYNLENANRRGELVERREVEQHLAVAFGRLRDRLSGIGTEIANAMPAELKASCKRIADDTVRVSLKELADSLSVLSVESDESGS